MNVLHEYFFFSSLALVHLRRTASGTIVLMACAKSALTTTASAERSSPLTLSPTHFLPLKRRSVTSAFSSIFTPIASHTRAIASLTAAQPPVG